jgi:hypothetical protein
MQPGDLRRFKDSLTLTVPAHFEGSTFMVLRVYPATERVRGVDILLNGNWEEGLGYFWVEDNSEAVNETG